jgi:hypothetical protein
VPRAGRAKGEYSSQFVSLAEGVGMWDEEARDPVRSWLVWWVVGGVIVVAIAAGIWYRYFYAATAPTPPPMTQQPAPAAPPETGPANPLPPETSTTALPALNDSDQIVADSLAGVLGHPTVAQFLVPQSIVRHIVVTVDNLPGKKVAVDLRPVKPTSGQTAVTTQGDSIMLSEANFDRYTPLVHAVQAADVKALAVVYLRLYPLFQQAYEDLGYPGKYFNDRLVAVIDNLLEAPEVPAPIALAQPKVMYVFADPELEARSAGQKLMIRMGPANARIIKTKLREFREEIAKKK